MRGLALAASCLVLVLAAGCGGSTDEATETGSGSPSPITVEAQADLAQHIEGVTLEGKQVSLEDFRGRPLFVNVWSSW